MKQKSENQKAFPRFLGILVVASLIGGVLGGLSGVAGYFWEDHTAFGAAFAHLLGAASPWAMAACAAVLLEKKAEKKEETPAVEAPKADEDEKN